MIDQCIHADEMPEQNMPSKIGDVVPDFADGSTVGPICLYALPGSAAV